MIEYLFSHQEGLDLFALLPKRLNLVFIEERERLKEVE